MGLKTGSHTLKLKLAYSKSSLTAMKNAGINFVKFNVLFRSDLNSSDAGTSTITLVKGTNSVLDEDVVFNGTDNRHYGQWSTITVSIDNLINKIDGNNWITLYDSYTKSGVSQMVYIGSIELVK